MIMKRIGLVFFILSFFVGSCVKENRPSYKKNDMFAEFNAQPGFVVLNLPPVLFKIVLKSSDNTDIIQKDLIDKIEIIKVLVFDESKSDLKTNDIRTNILEKANQQSLNLLTQIKDSKNQVSVFVKEDQQIISEILFLIMSDDGMFCIDCLGSFKPEDALNIYKSINTQNLKTSE